MAFMDRNLHSLIICVDTETSETASPLLPSLQTLAVSTKDVLMSFFNL